MRIGVISSTVFKIPLVGYGGLEMVAWLQAKGLAEKGHKVLLFAPDGSTCPGVEMLPFGPAGHVSEEMAYSGFPDFKQKDAQGKEVVVRAKHGGYWQHLLDLDCVIDHSWNKWPVMLKAEGALKAPCLLWAHAPVNTMFSSLPPIEKPCFVCISEDQRRHFEALHERPARVCYNGCDPNLYAPLDVPRNGRFLFLARFSSVKSPDRALRVCKQARAKLDLVGDTSITQEPGLFEHCKREADGKDIRIIGGIPRGETVFWHSQAHCFIHPTKDFREPFGLAPVESQMCQTPVIGWNRGSLPEIVKQGETGWLVSSEEEMVEVVKSVKEPDSIPDVMRKRCREWASQFSVEAMVDRVEELCVEARDTGGW